MNHLSTSPSSASSPYTTESSAVRFHETRFHRAHQPEAIERPQHLFSGRETVLLPSDSASTHNAIEITPNSKEAAFRQEAKGVLNLQRIKDGTLQEKPRGQISPPR